MLVVWLMPMCTQKQWLMIAKVTQASLHFIVLTYSFSVHTTVLAAALHASNPTNLLMMMPAVFIIASAVTHHSAMLAEKRILIDCHLGSA